MNSPDKATGPFVVLRHDPATRKTSLVLPNPNESLWSLRELHAHSLRHLLSALDAVDPTSHPDRVRYAFLSRVFAVTAPRPIGGKRDPGFRKVLEDDAHGCVAWACARACEPPVRMGRSRHPRPGFVMEYLVKCLGEVEEMVARKGEGKDTMDEWVMRGCERSGHLAEGRCLLPERLREGFMGAKVARDGGSMVVAVQGRMKPYYKLPRQPSRPLTAPSVDADSNAGWRDDTLVHTATRPSAQVRPQYLKQQQPRPFTSRTVVGVSPRVLLSKPDQVQASNMPPIFLPSPTDTVQQPFATMATI
ncbi:hypothetical protein HK101_004672 [Irineochytrium annulatum]|nr:hypothetical protein HK101_004672 [Irineochytrium annulatum]